ncbi:hypothetical protein [Streptomyces sp. NPDC058955]|uniref:ATP-binding protein n=1 Tax=unclassified Streptomyces TaxID=2593676 RepID=UPI003647FC46
MSPSGPYTDACRGGPAAPYFDAALGQVVRHARASRCEIVVTGGPERARLTVTDNGLGPSPAAAGSGLRGLGERLAAAGGTLATAEAPSGGFRLTAELPTSPERPAPSGGEEPSGLGFRL